MHGLNFFTVTKKPTYNGELVKYIEEEQGDHTTCKCLCTI